MSLTGLRDRMTVDLPEGEESGWAVERFEVTQEGSDWHRTKAAISGTGRWCPPGTYTRLVVSCSRGRSVIMSDTPDEKRDHVMPVLEAARAAPGAHCLVNGLGLGMVVAAMLSYDHIAKVTVIEIQPEVIGLVGPTLQARYGERLEIVHADALEWRPPKGQRYAVVWHDLWGSICEDNRADMTTLHRRYGRRADWQGSWGKGVMDVHRRQDRESRTRRW